MPAQGVGDNLVSRKPVAIHLGIALGLPWDVVTHSECGTRREAIHWAFKSSKSDSILGAYWR